MVSEILLPARMNYYEKLPVRIYSTANEASRTVANEMAELIRLKQERGECAVLGLATGSTPKRVYQELVRMHLEGGLSFQNVISFNLDEYYGLPTGALQSYQHFMEENLFKHVDIKKENYFIPAGDATPELVKMYCEQYERKIEEYGGIDFQLLGIGRNGHIGFNEPGSHINSMTRLITLDHITRNDAVKEFGGLANVPRKAITIGVSTILKANRIVLLAWGEQKANIIKKAVEGPVTEFVPASYLQGHRNVEIILDETAAAELTRRKAPWLTDDVLWSENLIKKAITQLALSLGKPILKLTNNDYNENGLSELLSLYGKAYDINIKVLTGYNVPLQGGPVESQMQMIHIVLKGQCHHEKEL
jgi:glucosamine-6-phosphate deaminase